MHYDRDYFPVYSRVCHHDVHLVGRPWCRAFRQLAGALFLADSAGGIRGIIEEAPLSYKAGAHPFQEGDQHLIERHLTSIQNGLRNLNKA